MDEVHDQTRFQRAHLIVHSMNQKFNWNDIKLKIFRLVPQSPGQSQNGGGKSSCTKNLESIRVQNEQDYNIMYRPRYPLSIYYIYIYTHILTSVSCISHASVFFLDWFVFHSRLYLVFRSCPVCKYIPCPWLSLQVTFPNGKQVFSF